MKRILVINDLSYVGRAALMANIPIISSFGHQVIPCPTVLLTRHTGYDHFKIHHLNGFFDQTIDDLIDHHQPLDGILIGYLDGIHQIGPIMKLLDHYPNTFVFVDPICADNGKFYHGKDQGYIDALKPLIKRADLIKPNITEALALCGYDLTTEITQETINSLTQQFQASFKSPVLLTGLLRDEKIINLLINNGHTISFSNPYIDRYYPGTGDMFDSIIIGSIMDNRSLNNAIQAAINFVLNAIGTMNNETKQNNLDGCNFEELISSERHINK